MLSLLNLKHGIHLHFLEGLSELSTNIKSRASTLCVRKERTKLENNLQIYNFTVSTRALHVMSYIDGINKGSRMQLSKKKTQPDAEPKSGTLSPSIQVLQS